MISKFVYSSSIKIHASRLDELLERIFCILLVIDVLSLQKVDACTSGSLLARVQANMADEAKLPGPIYSIFEVLLVLHVVNRSHGEKLGPFC